MARFSGGSGSGSGIPGPQGPAGPQGPQGPAGDGGGPKEWIAPNEAFYQIQQAHGGVEVQLAQPQYLSETVTISGNAENSAFITVIVSPEMNTILLDIWNNTQHLRNIIMDVGSQTRYFRINNPVDVNTWNLYVTTGGVTVYDQEQFWMQLEYGGAPVLWWNADNLGLVPEGDEWLFRGAKIDYHAYSVDAGTMIGTIYIANDSGDNNVTHIETSSGANDTGNVVLWNRSGNEKELYAYRADNEDDTVKVHWTAQVYYGVEVYD